MATTSKGFRYPVSTDTPNVPRDIGYLASDVDNWITNNPITINGTPVTLGGTVSITGLPTQTGNNGKYLTTDGSTASWATIDLSSYLTTANAASTYLTISNASTTYAAKASPTFTGTPLAPTATAGTNTTQIATTAFVSTAVSNLVNSAPSTLDTLNELAAALGNDASFSTTVTNSIAGKVSKSGGDTITASSASTVGLVIKGATSQTANIQEWQRSDGYLYASLNQYGSFYASGNLQVGTLVAIGSGTRGTEKVFIVNDNAANVGLILKGASSQTANLQEWQNSAGTVLARVDKDGGITTPNIGLSQYGGVYGVGSYMVFNPSDTRIVSGGLSVGAASVGTSAQLQVTNGVASTTGFIVKAAASQTANLQEWQNSAGTTLGYMGPGGQLKGVTVSAGSDNLGAAFSAYTNGASNIGIIVKAVASQTANLQEWQNSSGSVLSGINQYGSIVTYSGIYSSAAVGFGTSIGNYNAEVNINTTGASTIGAVIRGAVSQTANLQEWQNSAGTTLLSVSSDGVLNKTGTTYIGPQLWFADPGVGNETKFQFVKSNDGAWLTVKERATDQTYYEFGMSDNALDGGDYFQWSMSQWAAPGYGWMPLQLGTNSGKPQTLRFTGEQSLFWSNLSTPVNSPFYTYLDNNIASANYEVTKWTPANDINVNLRRQESTGSSATFNVDLSGYTYSGRMGYRVTIDSGATTFSYSTYGGDNSSGSAIAITAGSWQTLSNGTKIKIGAGALAGENWSFLAFPTPRVGIGGALDTSALTIIRPAAADKGLIIRAASGQTANLQGWQNSGGSETSYIDSSGAINTSGTIIQIGGTVLESGAIIRPYGASSTITIKNNSSTTAPSFIVKSTASQSANLFEAQNDSGSALFVINGGSYSGTGSASVGNIGIAAISFSSQLYVQSNSASRTGQIIKGAASQTADLQQWQNSSGTAMASINSSGALVFDASSTSAIVKWGSVNIWESVGSTASLRVNAYGASYVPIIAKGAASQTANLQEWQDSTGAVKAKITAAGAIDVTAITVNGSPLTGGSSTPAASDVELMSIMGAY